VTLYASKPGESRSHHMFIGGTKWSSINRTWFNDGQGIEIFWKANSSNGTPQKYKAYIPYEDIDNNTTNIEWETTSMEAIA
jgi:hypothetical protein